jgi:hypothetical protein
MKRLVGLIGVLAVGLLSAAPAVASTGSFTHATVTPDWSKASFGFTGEATACTALGSCEQSPVVVAMPSLPEYRCSITTQNALDSDPNTEVVWVGTKQTSNGPFSADLMDQSILHGVYGQRLCVGLIGSRYVKDVICEAQKKTLEEFGSGPITCNPVQQTFEEDIFSTIPTVETPQETRAPAPVTTTSPADTKPTTQTKKRRCPRGKQKVRVHGKIHCVRRHQKQHKAS